MIVFIRHIGNINAVMPAHESIKQNAVNATTPLDTVGKADPMVLSKKIVAYQPARYIRKSKSNSINTG
jgi:hypothetical protein